MSSILITSDTLTWGKSTLARVYTLSEYYNLNKVTQSIYSYYKPTDLSRTDAAENKRTLANKLKLSYRTYASYIYELPPQITLNGSENFFVPVEWGILRQMVEQRFNMGYSYAQVNNWVRVLLYFIFNCGRFHVFNKGMNQMIKELKMNKSEAVNNFEDLLARGIIKKVLEGYRNKSGFGVVSSYVLNDTSLLAAEFYEIWRRGE